MSQGGSLAHQLAPNPERVSQIKDETATAASVRHKCYSLTTMVYYKSIKFDIQPS